MVEFKVGIYIRLSKEDFGEGESESIRNQKNLLVDYVNTNGYILVDIYVDDGYTGTNFERPAFQRMLCDIENGKINMVVTKDLSRLSRDYIGTGEYVEKWFPAHKVRYVALTDNIDTFGSSSDNDMAPFKAILNDMYAKDLSKKIRTALRTMQLEGKWVGGCPPFGYEVDIKDKNHLVVQEEEASVVRLIFQLFLKGNSINQIKNFLNDSLTPTFSKMRNRQRQSNLWCAATIKKVLSNRLYTGDMVQNRRNRISYKYRKIVTNAPSKWIVVEGTHEAIIEKKIFYRVQEQLPKQRRRIDKKNMYLLDGLLKCADCHHNISIRSRGKNGKAYTVCNYYRTQKKDCCLCTSHSYDYDEIEKNVLVFLRRELAGVDVDSVVGRLPQNNLFKFKNKKMKFKQEIEKFNLALENLYIDKLACKISLEQYNNIYLKIKKELQKKQDDVRYLDEQIKGMEDYDWKGVISQFVKLDRATRELILGLINHISIHEDGNFDIYFNFKKVVF